MSLERLRTAVEYATPGEWWSDMAPDHNGDDQHYVAARQGGRQVCSYYADPDDVADAVYIATFDPPMVLALLDVAEAAEGHAGVADIDCPEGPDACPYCATRQSLLAAVNRLREVAGHE
jgi:hypothetical protein